jgi:thiol:disulfide interchange protein DsbA
MSKRTFQILFFGLLAFVAVIVFYQPAKKPSFEQIERPQAVTPKDGKVEVLSFFMYHCPYCYQIDSELEAWVLTNKDKVVFKRIPLSFSKDEPETRLFYALEASQNENRMHKKIMHAIHEEGNKLTRDETSVLNWITQQTELNGEFIQYWNSAHVIEKTNQAADIAKRFGINASPTIIVGGKYVTSPDHLARSELVNVPGALSKTLSRMLEITIENRKSEAK